MCACWDADVLRFVIEECEYQSRNDILRHVYKLDKVTAIDCSHGNVLKAEEKC